MQVGCNLSINDEVLAAVDALSKADNRNRSNMAETLIREAIQARHAIDAAIAKANKE